ncbi:MAG TPA: cytochrome c3 family protein [Thermoanaerobaculia bacterium]|nr:cytochrome c3 family protein [Thermoanaerobaculia bacterium]
MRRADETSALPRGGGPAGRLPLLLLLSLFVLLVPAAMAQEESAPAAPACGDCHDQAKAFATNPHARGTLVRGQVSNEACTMCHGDGAEHIEGGGDKTKITIPKGRAGAEEVCLLCHDTATDRRTPRAGMHANSDAVNCLTCHSIHGAAANSPALVVRNELDLCGSCHTEAASFRTKPYAHRLDRGGMACSSCHEPHGRPSTSARSLASAGHLRVTRAGEAPCLTCHTDKRGPYVFAHGSNEAGDCTSCHEVHGSSNPKQLKRASVQQVCIECHSPLAGSATLGSQPPSFHNLSTSRYQNCTTCHVAIHGSNRDPQLLK